MPHQVQHDCFINSIIPTPKQLIIQITKSQVLTIANDGSSEPQKRSLRHLSYVEVSFSILTVSKDIDAFESRTVRGSCCRLSY